MFMSARGEKGGRALDDELKFIEEFGQWPTEEAIAVVTSGGDDCEL